MRFWLLVSWRHAWETAGVEVRAMTDETEARRVARQYNAVVIEISQRDGDLKPHVDVHDYEFRDESDEPIPALWVDVPGMWLPPHGWVPLDSPVVRVGRDVLRESANL